MKKFIIHNLIIPMLIGITIGIFGAKVVGPAFDLSKIEVAIVVVISVSVIVGIYLVIRSRKEK